MIVKIGEKIYNSADTPILFVMHHKEVKMFFSHRPQPGHHLKTVVFGDWAGIELEELIKLIDE